MPYNVYKIIHLIGVLLTFMALGGAILLSINPQATNKKLRKWVGIHHGVGIVLALVGGFGLLARLQIHTPWPGWIYAKIGIWLVVIVLLPLALRKPQAAKGLWFGLIVLGGVAAYLAGYKPF